MSDDRTSTDAQEQTGAAVVQGPVAIVTKLSRMPAVTWLTLGVALLALPGLVTLIDVLGVSLGPLVQGVLQWAVALAVLGVVVGVEDRSLASVGVRRPTWWDVPYLMGTAIAVLAVFIAGPALLSAAGLPVADGLSSLESTPGLGVSLFAAVTTGVVEEMLYRGYPLERLLEYTDSPAIAGSLTVTVFTLAHLVTWPVGTVLLVGMVSAVWTAVYLRRPTLVPVVGSHVGIWVVAVLGQYFA
ncbi:MULTISPECIES: CPBP family intramembrane glutamic endopeptidase [Haloarcula]|uniref:CPBP family intramembrane glutamic endopeptidase n=1 Tax=Haloarcula TaxID=2237 RepID=UPI0023E84EB6|nr:type II CAAX endopeptidase family protein [Halomicroarcula sp. SHR3]